MVNIVAMVSFFKNHATATWIVVGWKRKMYFPLFLVTIAVAALHIFFL